MALDFFDHLARALATTTSRRQGLGALAAGLAFHLTRAAPEPAAAACRTFGDACNRSGKACCDGQGIRCKDGTCRCRGDHARCAPGPGCQDLKRDANHCGRCGKACPAGKPCCINGECRPRCGESCCANCFVELLANNTVKPDSELCCGQGGGTICRKPGGKRADDRCCYPDEACLNGRCCSDGLYGTTNCAGKCCAQAACCNGTTCCAAGKVCARKPGASKDSCVQAVRACDAPADCFTNEICHGDVCCAPPRTCAMAGGADPFCCAANTYCEFNNTDNARCTIIGQTGSTYRGSRVRP